MEYRTLRKRLESPDCGATYYAQYLITVKNLGVDSDTEHSEPFTVTLTGWCGCLRGIVRLFRAVLSGLEQQHLHHYRAEPLSASTSFTVFFKTPQSGDHRRDGDRDDRTTPGPVGPPTCRRRSRSDPHHVGCGDPDLLVACAYRRADRPRRRTRDSQSGKGPFSSPSGRSRRTPSSPGSRSHRARSEAGHDSVLVVQPEVLGHKLDVQSSGDAVTFGGKPPLDRNQFLVITMVRDWTTLDRKPSSVFNATVWYTDAGWQPHQREGLRQRQPGDRGTVCLPAHRHDDERQGVLTGGYMKFIIWARHNGVMSW